MPLTKILKIFGMLLLIFSLQCTIFPHAFDQAEAKELKRVTVFQSGTEGYDTFRIPAMIRANDGTLLAFAEGRVEGAGDSGNIDLVLKRSFDNGKTWGPLQVIGDNGDNVFGNPAPVVDRKTGTIVLLSTHNAGNVSEMEIRRGEVTQEQTRRIFVQYSYDSGGTWTEPAEITKTTKRGNWRWYATGPGHGIQLKYNRKYNGRLIIPANHSVAPPAHSEDDGSENKYLSSHVLYSDDGGYSWEIGAVDETYGDINSYYANEQTAAELKNGKIYFNSRNQYGSGSNRLATYSSNGGLTYNQPFQPVADLITPVVQGSVLHFSSKNLLIFSSPGDPNERKNLTISYSNNNGKKWRTRFVIPGYAAYSDLVSVGDNVGVLFENGIDGPYEKMDFTILNPDP